MRGRKAPVNAACVKGACVKGARVKASRVTAERRGRLAEAWAAVFLRLKGYRIVARRYRCPVGEIDIIAVGRGAAVAVEVKARRDRDMAIMGVTSAQQRRIERAMLHFASRGAHPAAGQMRFDVIAVGRYGLLRHHVDAWRPQIG